MKYSNKTNSTLKLFCEELSKYLLNEKHIVLNDLQKLITHFATEDKINIKGSIEFKIHSKSRNNEGTVTTLSETVIFTPNGYFIKSFTQQDHFGEYYTNKQDRIGEDEREEFIPEYLESTLESILKILKDENGYFEVSCNKFGLK